MRGLGKHQLGCHAFSRGSATNYIKHLLVLILQSHFLFFFHFPCWMTSLFQCLSFGQNYIYLTSWLKKAAEVICKQTSSVVVDLTQICEDGISFLSGFVQVTAVCCWVTPVVGLIKLKSFPACIWCWEWLYDSWIYYMSVLLKCFVSYQFELSGFFFVKGLGLISKELINWLKTLSEKQNLLIRQLF